MKNNINFKETNISWIGEIPIEWSLIRAKYLFNRTKEINKDLRCKNLLSLTYEGVLNKDFYASEGLRPENYNTYQLFDKDDLVFKMIDLENVKTSRVGIVHEYGIMSSAYICFKPLKEKIYPKFSYWFFYDLYKKEIYNSIGSGVRSTLSSDDMSEFEIPVPKIKEQKIISRYLDKKITQINSLVEKIQKKIKVLKELRTSLINQCVTKGLDPNVEMKDSGVEWIGKMPKHWNVKKIKYVSNQISEKRLPVDGDIKISPENVESGTGGITNYYSDYDTEGQIFQSGDILFNKLRVYLNKVVLCDFDGLSMGEMIVIRPVYVMGNFLHKILSSNGLINHVNSLSEGVKLPRPSVSCILDTFIPIPPEDEQTSISESIQTKLGYIDLVITKHSDRIRLMQEYRQSIIFSVVTGKVRITEDRI